MFFLAFTNLFSMKITTHSHRSNNTGMWDYIFGGHDPSFAVNTATLSVIISYYYSYRVGAEIID